MHINSRFRRCVGDEASCVVMAWFYSANPEGLSWQGQCTVKVGTGEPHHMGLVPPMSLISNWLKPFSR